MNYEAYCQCGWSCVGQSSCREYKVVCPECGAILRPNKREFIPPPPTIFGHKPKEETNDGD